MTKPHAEPNNHLDPNLRPLADALDALGAAERDAAPDNLEQSLLAATTPLRRADTTNPEPAPQPVIARIGFNPRNTLRLAAAIALIATATITGLFILTQPKTTTPTPIANQSTQQIIESIDTELEEWLADLEALEDIYTDSNAASDEFWTIDESLNLIEEATS